jgi:hypothetical protein
MHHTMPKSRRRAFAGITAAAVLTLSAVGVSGPASAASAGSATDAEKELAGMHHPRLTVTPAKNLRDGSTITVRGTGYDTTTANPFGTGNAGTYVEIGWVAKSGWKPSQGFAEATRSNADAIWTHSDPTPGDPKQAELDANGSFKVTVEIDDAALEAKKIPHAILAVFTVSALGTVSAGAEADVPITLKQAAQPGNGHHGGRSY